LHVQSWLFFDTATRPVTLLFERCRTKEHYNDADKGIIPFIFFQALVLGLVILFPDWVFAFL
jgi:TRAP-type mannitol/chloroaromatic compound transport system permease large subunit